MEVILGCVVRHNKHGEIGLGKVLAIDGDKITVSFLATFPSLICDKKNLTVCLVTATGYESIDGGSRSRFNVEFEDAK